MNEVPALLTAHQAADMRYIGLYWNLPRSTASVNVVANTKR